MEVLRNQNERMTKQVADLTSENKKLVEPLKQAEALVAEYRRQLQNYTKDKHSLAVSTYIPDNTTLGNVDTQSHDKKLDEKSVIQFFVFSSSKQTLQVID